MAFGIKIQFLFENIEFHRLETSFNIIKKKKKENRKNK
jgi:hypothetical protein